MANLILILGTEFKGMYQLEKIVKIIQGSRLLNTSIKRSLLFDNCKKIFSTLQVIFVMSVWMDILETPKVKVQDSPLPVENAAVMEILTQMLSATVIGKYHGEAWD